jgi:hypothetical protein
MKKDDLNKPETKLTEQNDQLRSEYDLSQLQVRRLGPGRRQFDGKVVRLEPDVAAVFHDAEAVSEALRLLIKVAQSNNQYQRRI